MPRRLCIGCFLGLAGIINAILFRRFLTRFAQGIPAVGIVGTLQAVHPSLRKVGPDFCDLPGRPDPYYLLLLPHGLEGGRKLFYNLVGYRIFQGIIYLVIIGTPPVLALLLLFGLVRWLIGG